jgi:hypothetical protein
MAFAEVLVVRLETTIFTSALADYYLQPAHNVEKLLKPGRRRRNPV